MLSQKYCHQSRVHFQIHRLWASAPPYQSRLRLLPAQYFDTSAGAAAVCAAPETQTRCTPDQAQGILSFHYDDIIRVNNVRNAWKINCPGREDKRQFYDRSLSEVSAALDPKGLKSSIQRGMEHASVVCVLVGTHTWSRPWVRYEIARAVIEKKGLLAVHINGLRHHQRLTADANGENPLGFMGVGCPKQGIYYLYEHIGRPVLQYGQMVMQWQWERYSKYTMPVPVPNVQYRHQPKARLCRYRRSPLPTTMLVGKRHENIGSWIDTAALRAGR